MLEQFLKDKFDINKSDIIHNSCSNGEPGTVHELLEAINSSDTEQIIMDRLEPLRKEDKKKVLSYLGSILNGFRRNGRA